MPGRKRGRGKARRAGLRTSSGWLALALAGMAAAALPAPAPAQNECGAPPSGGGTVTCPPGNYPDGIDYNVVQDLTVVLQPGVTTDQSVEITGAGAGVDLRLEGPTDTLIRSSQSGYSAGEGVRIESSGGSVFVAVDRVATTGADISPGIDALAGLDVTVASNAVTTTGTNSAGILAASFGGNIDVTSGTVATVGNLSDGIRASASSGSVRVASGSVVTSGDQTEAIGATTIYGDVVVDSGSVATMGRQSIGIFVETNYGSATVTSGEVETGGDIACGICAGAFAFDGSQAGGPLSIGSGRVTTRGDNSDGINASSDSAVAVTSDEVRTEGRTATAITAVSLHDDVTVGSGTIATLGDYSTGIQASAGQGDVTVTSGSVSTTGRQSDGISAFSTFGAGTLSIDSDEVVTTGDLSDGIAVLTSEGDVSIVSGSVSTGGYSSNAILASSTYGDARVESVDVETAGDTSCGICVNTNRSDPSRPRSNLSIASGGAVTRGEGSSAIAAFASNSDIDVTSESVVTEGRLSDGIRASTVGGRIEVASGRVETLGELSNGISASGGADGVAIESLSVTTGGDSSYAILATAAFGDVAIDSGAVTTGGTDSTGIYAEAFFNAFAATGGRIFVTSGDVTTNGASSPGISARQSSFDLCSVVPESCAASAASVIAPAALDGPGVSITSGDVTTAGDDSPGVAAYAANGDIEIFSTGMIRTAGANATGIYAVGGGVVTIDSSNVVTTGDGATGIFAVQLGDDGDVVAPGGALVPAALGPNGGISISSGAVTTNGPGAPGIDAYAATGDVEVLGTGAVTTAGANSPGIIAESADGVVTVIADAVSTTGTGSDAIAVAAATRNFVTVRGLVQATNGFEIQAEGGPATITVATTGIVRGAVDLTDSNDSLANGGLFDAVGASQFGAGNDVFTNSGTIRSAGGAAVLAGLESFTSSGLVELRDGATGDSLDVAGAFVGSGGRLGLDVDFSAGTADLLITGAATGTTLVDVSPIGGSAVGFDPIRIVDAGAGTSATAFALASEVNASPFVQLGLQFDANANDFLLVAQPDQAVFEAALYPEQALNVWYQSARAVAAQLATRRDSVPDQVSYLWSENGFGAWAQLHAGETERDATQAFGTAPAVFDVGYEQQFEGLQGGFDYRLGAALVGLTVGISDSDADFAASFGRLELDAVNLGAYASYESGDFFLHALAKVDWVDARSLPGAGLAAEFDGTAFGVSGTAGYRFALGNAFYAEPSVSLSWVELDLDDYVIAGAAVAFDDLTSLRGAAGLRVGGDIATPAGIVSPFVGLYAIDEFDGDARSDFALGATMLALVQDTPGTWGQVQGGISFIAGAFEAFARGEVDFGGDVEGVAGRFGARLRF